jgi:MFS family permease
MTGTELRATIVLAGVFALRLLGLFMVYPIFSLYAARLPGASPAMIGLALGAYGLAQALLQMPFGLLSDRIGRKPVIAAGLALFGAGSVVAATSHTIRGVLIGRVIQGAGAVGSAILALVADLTREEVRTRAMAVVGMTIGLSFLIAMLSGPALAAHYGLSGVFWVTAGLAVLGIALTLFATPKEPARLVRRRGAEAVPALLGRALGDHELLRLNFAIFALHAILTASFLVVPGTLTKTFHLSTAGQWKLYLPVLVASVVLMVPAIMAAESRGRMKEVFVGSIGLLLISVLLLGLRGEDAIAAAAGLVIFFTAFNIMEAMLPSLITKIAPADAKGTATGVYSSAQFLGIFAGGAAGGVIFGAAGARGVLSAAVGLCVIWLVIAATMRRPGRYSSEVVRVEASNEAAILDVVAQLARAPGVVEAVAAFDERAAYLKIDRSRYDAEAVERILAQAR